MEKSNLVFIVTCVIFLLLISILFVALYRMSKKLADNAQDLIQNSNDFLARAQTTLDKADKVFNSVANSNILSNISKVENLLNRLRN